jgi:hypothetical protein
MSERHSLTLSLAAQSSFPFIVSQRGRCSVEDGATALLNEPHLGLLLGDTLELAEVRLACATLGNTFSNTTEDDVEIHTENTSGGVVLDAEINVFVNTKTEVTWNNY